MEPDDTTIVIYVRVCTGRVYSAEITTYGKANEWGKKWDSARHGVGGPNHTHAIFYSPFQTTPQGELEEV